MSMTSKYKKGDVSLKANQVNFTTRQLTDALFDVLTLMESSLCPFFLLDETARQCISESQRIEPHLELDEITVGVNNRHMGQSVKEMIRTIKPHAEWLGRTVTYEHGEVPIVIWIIEREFEVLQNPDKIFFFTEDFYVPNPFRKYWKQRDLVVMSDLDNIVMKRDDNLSS